MNEFQPGDQIAYVPTHVEGNDLTHPDVQFGFVVAYRFAGEPCYFCRYYRKETGANDLRNKANSELTPARLLVLHRHSRESIIREHWNTYVEPTTGIPYPK